MANLIALPNSDALDIIKDKLLGDAKKFILIGSHNIENKVLDDLIASNSFTYEDISNYVYFEDEIHSSYFDNDGNLTINLILPIEEDFKQWSYALTVITEDRKLLATTALMKMQLARNIGGEQTVKIAVSGEAGTVNFKATDYVTWSEAEQFFINTALSNLALQGYVCNEMMKDTLKKEGINI
jgi:hypothetical protein